MKNVEVSLAIIFDVSMQRVLVGIRPDGTHLAGMAEFPGGKVEQDETSAECIVREAFEETGLNVRILQQWDRIEYGYEDRVVALNPFICTINPNVDPHLPWQWIPLESLSDLEFPPANAEIIKKLGSLQIGRSIVGIPPHLLQGEM